MNLTATQLGVHAAKAALNSASVSPEKIDHVVFGKLQIFAGVQLSNRLI